MKAKGMFALVVMILLALWLLKYAFKLAFFASKWIILLAIVLAVFVWISSKTSRRTP